MGEGLVITATIDSASNMLNVIKDTNLLHWEWSPEQIDVAARWLPRKGFEILPKIFDMEYKPGTVGDEGDRLISKIGGCCLELRRGRDKPMPVWSSSVLKLSQMREELKRVLNENVLDFSFEKEIINELEKKFGEAGYEANEESLSDDNRALKEFASILMKLAECIDQVIERGDIPGIFFEFFIPRE